MWQLRRLAVGFGLLAIIYWLVAMAPFGKAPWYAFGPTRLVVINLTSQKIHNVKVSEESANILLAAETLEPGASLRKSIERRAEADYTFLASRQGQGTKILPVYSINGVCILITFSTQGIEQKIAGVGDSCFWL